METGSVRMMCTSILRAHPSIKDSIAAPAICREKPAQEMTIDRPFKAYLPDMAVINTFVSIILFSMDTKSGGDTISAIPIEPDHIDTYKRMIGDTEITVENLGPNFKTEKDKINVKSQIVRILYEVFSKYDENC